MQQFVKLHLDGNQQERQCYRNSTHAGYEAVIWNAQQCASLNLLLDRLRLLGVMDIIDI